MSELSGSEWREKDLMQKERKKMQAHTHTQKSDMMEECNSNEKNSCTARRLQGLRGSQ